MKKLLPIFLSLFLPLFALSASAASFSPLQIGLGSPDWQLVSEDTPVIGLRLNLPRSFNDTVAGLDLGLLSDDTATFSGLRLNAVSFSQTCNGIAIALFDMAVFLNGIQIGLGTDAEELHGVQIGLFNGTRTVSYSPTVRGLQIGLVNYANSLRGVQLGLLNIDRSSDYPYLPLLRASF